MPDRQVTDDTDLLPHAHTCTELQDNDDEAEGKITQTLANIKDIYGELIQFSWQVFQTETTVEIHYF